MDSVSVLAQGPAGCILRKRLSEQLWQQKIFASQPSITVMLAGRKQVQTLEDEFCELKHDQIAFMPADIYQISDLLPDRGAFDSYIFFLSPDLLRKFIIKSNLRQMRPAEITGVFITTRGSSIDAYLASLETVFHAAATSQSAMLEVKLQELLLLLEQDCAPGQFQRWLLHHQGPPVRDLERFMRSFCHTPLQIEDFARLSGRSESSFLRDFKKQFGSTPRRWLTTQRLQKAYELLQGPDPSVTEVAFAVGYENISYFIRIFRAQYGVSPGELIKQSKASLTDHQSA